MTPNGALKDQQVLVTGAVGGLGKRICYELATREAVIGINDIPSRGKEISSLYEELTVDMKAKAFNYPADITNNIHITSMFENISKTVYGLRGLVNCAAILERPTKNPEDWDLGEARKIMETNYYGAARCVKYAAPFLRKSKGVIVNVLGVGARKGDSVAPYYAAAKAALANATRSWAIEFGDEVSVFGVSPGMMGGTPMFDADLDFAAEAVKNTRSKKPIKPTDIASIIVDLIESRSVNPKKYENIISSIEDGRIVWADDGLGW